MRRLAAIALGLIAFAGSLSHASTVGPQAPSSALTRIDVMVEDSDGKAITDITRGDLTILVDGLPVPLESFAPGSTTAPLTLVALVDITVSQFTCPCCVALQAPEMSTAGRNSGVISSGKIGNALGEFTIRGVRPEDRVRIGSIGRRTVLSRPFQGGSKEMTAAWKALFAVPPVEWLGPSPIWDAIYDATAAVEKEPGRRAIVVVSDGQASGNERGSHEVAVAASLAGVSVSVVAQESMLPTVPLSSMARYGVDPTEALRRVSDLSGGTFNLDAARIDPSDACFNRDPAPYFSRILNKLRLAYELGFVFQGMDDKQHRLEVLVKRPGAIARVRKVVISRPLSSVSYLRPARAS